MKNKIGVGVITCNRQDFFEKVIKTVPDVDQIVVVNDGIEYTSDAYPSKVNEVIQHSRNKCVGISKNEALRYLIQNDCDHLFLIEDDIMIKNPEVFNHYIKAASKSGIWHLNFAYHGPANFKPGQYGTPNPRQVVDYGDGIEIALCPNSVGAFSYYLRGVIKNIGYIDERFHNSWDHVEHTYRIIKAGLHPPFWWFADVADSMNYLEELATSITVAEHVATGKAGDSTIKKDNFWQQKFQEGAAWYRHKHGWFPTQTPDTPPQNVLAILENIQNTYAKEV